MRCTSTCCLALSALALAGCYRVKLEGLSYVAPDGWIREEPTSEHRLIQYRLRSESKAIGDARLVVYYFGKQATVDIDAQIARWAGWFQQPDGRPSLDVAVVEHLEFNGLEVHTIEVEGTYVAEDADGEPVNRPDRSMRAAIVFSEMGPYYFKVVGPTATVQRWEPTYDALLASLAPAPVKSAPDDSESSVEEVAP